MLRKDICRYGPQIMRLRYGFLWQGTHFVVGIGRDLQDTTWLINDSHDGREQDITEWANDYRDYRRCIGPEYVYVDKQCSLVVRFHSPGELVITDSLGRREGYDPISDTLYMGEIPS
ncbi:MAG: hypothetical protein U9Q07_07415, partial [Planctomycetota bacterium]|nr:hypothetical protein [Planctomycetota bacterium]